MHKSVPNGGHHQIQRLGSWEICGFPDGMNPVFGHTVLNFERTEYILAY